MALLKHITMLQGIVFSYVARDASYLKDFSEN